MALLDHLLGDPDHLPVGGLARGIRRGSEEFAVRCVRALGEAPPSDPPLQPPGPGRPASPPGRSGRSPRAPADTSRPLDLLLPLLAAPSAALRRAAARALGNLGDAAALRALTDAAGADRTEEGRLALAVARVRCGASAPAVAEELVAFDRRTLRTLGGPRAPAAVTGGPPLVERLWQALGEPDVPRPRAALLAERRAAVTRGAASARAAEAVQALACLGHPADLATLEALFRSAGRRGEHALLVALGLTGDPRAAPALRDALRATDVDPGRGFAQRRIAATGLGRLGLRRSGPWLLRALEDEVADYEGRPGAGLGIQYPVRTNLLWALGEVGAPEAVPALVAHLADTHGSALGGFYLPAMDALVKLGPTALPALRETAARAAETTAAHAVAALLASGDDMTRWRADPRPGVRRMAAP